MYLFKFIFRILSPYFLHVDCASVKNITPVYQEQAAPTLRRYFQVVTGGLYPVSIPLLPLLEEPKGTVPLLSRELLTRGWRGGNFGAHIVLVWELRKLRRRASKARHLIASRQNTVGETFNVNIRPIRAADMSCEGSADLMHWGRRALSLLLKFSRWNSDRWLNIHYEINGLEKSDERQMLVLRSKSRRVLKLKVISTIGRNLSFWNLIVNFPFYRVRIKVSF